ncbi:MAG: hypothetical protein HY233_10310 [Acidobacteriales bacterium]|nr:hypothetical protein [Candidatus Koribacter versatilis]MBI3646343.1 hypothetical protein [Terriglobales bacterium]
MYFSQLETAVGSPALPMILLRVSAHRPDREPGPQEGSHELGGKSTVAESSAH